MASTSGIGSPASGGLPVGQPDAHDGIDPDPQDEQAFQQILQGTPHTQSTGPGHVEIDSKFRMSLWSDSVDPNPSVDLDNYQPEVPEVPDPAEKPSNFWTSLRSGIDAGLNKIKDFLAKPEVAQFVRAANVVFAGAMVVAAGVMIATGVGAPAGIAALALAGGAGLAMQLPAVHDKLQAGVVALMSPVLGKETAEKLGPLVTQGLIAGLMIAIVATGGQAGSAQGALDAAVGVFNTMKDVFNGIAQVYQSGGPMLELLGVDVDTQALKDMAAVFGTMGALMPDLSKFAEGLGGSLKDFLANPDMDAFKKFISTVKDAPESLTKLIDSDFLKNLGAMIDSAGQFLDALKSDMVLQNILSLLAQSNPTLKLQT